MISVPTVGEILKEEFMASLGVNAPTLAKGIGVSISCMQDILRGRCQITEDISRRLGRYFGISEDYFLSLQDDIEVRNERGRALRRKRTAQKQIKRQGMMRTLGKQIGLDYDRHVEKVERSSGYMRDGNVSHYVATKPTLKTRDRSRMGPPFLPPHRDRKRMLDNVDGENDE